MKVVKTNGAGGEWVKVSITINGKDYTRSTNPNGISQYANVTNGRNTSIRSGSKSAQMIDAAIRAATA